MSDLDIFTDRELLNELIRRGADRAAANTEGQLSEATSVLRHALIVRRAKTKSPKASKVPITQSRLAVNPDPLSAVDVGRCVHCRKKAPWCSCGKAAYSKAKRTKEPAE